MASRIANWKLTFAEPASVEHVRRQTWAGQAGWADGPDICEHCQFWNDLGRKCPSTQRACEMYVKLVGKIGPRVPAGAASCKYFKPRELQHSSGKKRRA